MRLLSKGNFTLGESPRIPLQNYFYLSYFFFADSILHVEILRGIVREKYLPGWNCLEYPRVFSTREILHNGVFHGIDFPGGTFCASNFLPGVGEGLFAGKLIHRGVDFPYDFKNNQKLMYFSIECELKKKHPELSGRNFPGGI